MKKVVSFPPLDSQSKKLLNFRVNSIIFESLADPQNPNRRLRRAGGRQLFLKNKLYNIHYYIIYKKSVYLSANSYGHFTAHEINF